MQRGKWRKEMLHFCLSWQQINDGDNIIISLKIIQKRLTQNKQTKNVLIVISNEKIK